MLEARDLHAFYGDSHILHGIELCVPRAARVAVLGRNGAGKSTLLKSLTNTGPTTKGTIRWEGRDLDGLASFQRAQLGMGFVPEDRRILGSLTVLENLRMAYTGTPAARRSLLPEQALADFPMLGPIKHRLGGYLSGGQQQILALARAAVANPSLLLLDEPTEGLAPIIVEGLVQDVLRICRTSGCTLLLCEQSVWFARKCTEFVHIIESGHLVFSGAWSEFDASPAIRNRHLGVT